MYWKNGKGDMLRSLTALKALTEQGGTKLVFATNAGIYMQDNSPLGLYVENGKQLRPLNLKKVPNGGNFYMQPNGVFLLTASEAQVVVSSAYAPYKGKAVFATQSGPMLVINGAINNTFTSGSANVNIRSGVGVMPDGKVVFAISDDFVNFYDFAIFFRDQLKCNNALYLDGAICRMYLPGLDRMELGGDFGAMIGIVK